jgi:hypothetical protein
VEPSPRKISPQDVEETTRKVMEDVVMIAERLAPLCSSVADLVGMCRLAVENDGQLKLLMRVIYEQRR